MIETIIVLAMLGGLIKLITKQKFFLNVEESPPEAIPQAKFVFMEPAKDDDNKEYEIPELVEIFNKIKTENKKQNDYIKHVRYTESETRNINFRTELGKLHQLNLEQHFPSAAKA